MVDFPEPMSPVSSALRPSSSKDQVCLSKVPRPLVDVGVRVVQLDRAEQAFHQESISE